MEWTEGKSALLQRALAGDQPALAALLTEASSELHGRIGRRIPSDLRGIIDSDDLMQDVYVEAFRSISGFVLRGPESFGRWLGTIALRRLRHEIRSKRTQKRGGGALHVQRAASPDASSVTLLRLLESEDSTPSRQVARGETLDALRDALQTLPEPTREAVRLVYLEGLSVAECARRLGRTERAVHSLCYRAKQLLRDSLERNARDGDT